ncbi:MAG: FUSC family protein [Bosea sp.]|nr:FUSC family protein [Bosea sp. (in: a-proteobacteria)]
MAGARTTAASEGTVARPLIPVDLGWRNIVFSLRTAAAAVMALAICYRLELRDPQWATLTVNLLAQPTVGAALSKSLWRTIGTVLGGITGLGIVAAFAEAPALMVGATVAAVFVSFYLASRLRNFVSYGALLFGYTTILVAYEGSADPLNAWIVAGDRTAAILIGIGCGTLMTMLVLPRYAGDALREQLAGTRRELARYVATALRLSATPAAFARLRGGMVRRVVQFDALRASALFEAPEMRADGPRLQRIVHELLLVMSVARGLYVRIDAFTGDAAAGVETRVRPALEGIAARIDALAADGAPRPDAAALRHEAASAAAALKAGGQEIAAMAGTAPFDALANALLILRRAGELVEALALATMIDAAGAGERSIRQPAVAAAPNREPLLLGLRGAVAILLLTAVWMATGWSEGFAAVAGGVITLFLSVNQDREIDAALPFLTGTAIAVVASYLVFIFVLPRLEGFGQLAAVLMLLLLPAGLLAGTPATGALGTAIGAMGISQLSTGNLYVLDEAGFVSNAFALLAGMAATLLVLAVWPVTSAARRGRTWRRTVGAIVPGVARGTIPPREGSAEIVSLLATLLPRLSLDQQRDEDFFRGSLGSASSCIEIGRLRALGTDAAMPADAAAAIAGFLAAFAAALERLADARPGDKAALAATEAAIEALHKDLAGRSLAPGASATALLEAGASVRFLADRFTIDGAWLARRFEDG